MQPPPSAAELLAVVSEVLAGEIVPALQGPAQHHARVAASLVGIVERELRLGPEAAETERRALIAVLEADPGPTGDPTPEELDLTELRRRLATRLRGGLADDPTTGARVIEVLLDAVRADLAIAKPGHADWDGD